MYFNNFSYYLRVVPNFCSIVLCNIFQQVGQKIEIRPGLVSKDSETGGVTCRPIISCIVSLFAEQNDLAYAVPGGLIGVGTKIDPQLCRADRLVGHVLGQVGTLPDIYVELEISFFLLRRLLGVRTEGDQKGAKASSLLFYFTHDFLVSNNASESFTTWKQFLSLTDN